MRLILASTSPRRKELLSKAGLEFDVLAVDIDESAWAGEMPLDYLHRMVKTKALHACQKITPQMSTLIITADTIGIIDGQILQKPKDKADAFDMWDKLSGKTHQICTAICASVLQDEILTQRIIICTTDVSFVQLTHAQKEAYWATGEPADKAGAYAIQGGAMAWVERIEGSYTNVVGLPLAQTLALLNELGYEH